MLRFSGVGALAAFTRSPTEAVGCLICGFFWELWNFYSHPKWVYQVPFVDFLHVFEMPLLGYLGYVPFSLELFALYHLVVGLFVREEKTSFIQVSLPKSD